MARGAHHSTVLHSTVTQRNRNIGDDNRSGGWRSYDVQRLADTEARSSWETRWDSTNRRSERYMGLRNYLAGDPIHRHREDDFEIERARDAWCDLDEQRRASAQAWRARTEDIARTQRWEEKVIPNGAQRDDWPEAVLSKAGNRFERGAAHGPQVLRNGRCESCGQRVFRHPRDGTSIEEDDFEFLVEQQEERCKRSRAELMTLKHELAVLDTVRHSASQTVAIAWISFGSFDASLLSFDRQSTT
eukprot:SAG11_NODE_5787_length_1464_cov_1.434432_1_plen_245_part_00